MRFYRGRAIKHFVNNEARKQNNQPKKDDSGTVYISLGCLYYVIISIVTFFISLLFLCYLTEESTSAVAVSFLLAIISPFIALAFEKDQKKEDKETLQKMYAEFIEKEKADAERMRSEQKEKYLKLKELKIEFERRNELLSKLTNKYFSAVCNYIDSLPFHPFSILEDSDLNPGLLASLYLKKDNPLLRFYIHYDGYVSSNNTFFTEEMRDARKTTSIFVEELKNRIEELWNDNETIACAVYFIIRNNIIRRYHSILNDDGICTIEDLIENIKGLSDEATMCTAKAFYTYHWLYANDINLSIKSTYDRISKEIDKQYEIHMIQTKKNSLFSDNIYDTTENSSVIDVDLIDGANILNTIDIMNGREFEEFIANLFRKKGYKTTLTPSSGDYGIDVIIENDFLKIGIQTKCYSDKVSNSAVQEAFTGIKHYGLDKAMVITNNYFQPSAIRLAKENNVILWDRERLEEELSK